MAASSTDKITNTASTTTSRPQATQVTSTRAAGVLTLAGNSFTGWPTSTDSKVHFCTYKLNTSGAKIAGSQIDMEGILSGTTIGSIVIRGGTDVGNAIGDIIEMAPTAAWGYDLYQGLSVSHNKDGSLLTSAVQTALSLGTGALNGWNALGFAPATVTYNGNRSYDMVFNGQDLTTVVSAGMRLRTTRTVPDATQCTSLNGTNQYYSKSSPAGMTFIDDFVVGAWVKLTSYATSTIISRYNGTSGWDLQVNSSGQVTLLGYNAGSANNSGVVSTQVLPLNKWVFVAAQLDMSSFTASTTTSYVMFDGVDVPATVFRAGTNPTALINNVGNLEIGSRNAGTQFFPGKIAQAFVSSAKITQANIKTLYSQGLTAALISTNSIISAYSFNNSINDLNTTNANNLTANGSAVATNADSFCGAQADGTISSTLDYCIVQKATFSTNTTVTVQVPEGCTIPTSGGVSSVVYSSNKAPYGMPATKYKWSIDFKYKTQVSQVVTSTSAWLNITGVQFSSLPLGEFDADCLFDGKCTATATNFVGAKYTISTATTTQSNEDLSGNAPVLQPTASESNGQVAIRGPISNSAQTTWYLNTQPVVINGTTTNFVDGATSPALFRFYPANLMF
jgi:hypothetical protein